MAQRRVLLVSNSTTHPTGYLDHCAKDMVNFLGPDVKTILFVPYALKDHDGYAAKAKERFAVMGFKAASIHEFEDQQAAVASHDAMFVGGGNTFRLLKTLQDKNLIQIIRRRVLEQGMPYMGASAGSNIACPGIFTTNDMPIVQPSSFLALGLVPFQLNAHYLEPDPTSTHKGETRAERLAQFHEENDLPVVGLPEGMMIEVVGDKAVLRGMDRDVRLFAPGKPMETRKTGATLDDFMQAAEPAHKRIKHSE
ncbi:uncharacterized protein MONBRDRAFT_35833 [Monosiga brevicollis MX1]|uniref:dipeptidase E n=1 Tax=Monosiga brevicollis TaxID=81824 RepID=A9US34_MONBE|nr:uncharacterized protein MONBRDRAFT_35833 [Monosiga brevicollis MX1]EDQ91709.1 predicted protein [Monosiga brevicollis MX1]|eukprot:XP_001742995.1 hypothetical protein [Monosiga brevicollis MX1]